MHATLEEGRARSRASDLVTSKFNKRHKPIRTAAKTRRAIKPAITRFSLSLFSRCRGRGEERGGKEGKRRPGDGTKRVAVCCTVVNRKG